MSSAFPGTAIGLISLFIFVVFLATMMEIPGTESITWSADTTSKTIASFGDAANSLVSSDEGFFGFGRISSFVDLIWNLALIPIVFIVQIFVSFAVFISLITLLPFEISGLLVVILGAGLILSLLKYIIPE